VPRGGIRAQSAIVGVPQGLSVSNLIAEICMKKIDALLMNRDDLFYIRYVDDILILCDSSRAEDIYHFCSNSLTAIGLKPHNKDDEFSKSQIGLINDGFEFLSYKVKGDIISPKVSSIISFESKIASVLTAFKYKYDICKNDMQRERAVRTCEWRLNIKITGCIFEGKRLGWAFYFSQSNDTSAFRHVDSVVRNMVIRSGLQADIKVKSLLKTFYETRRMDKSTHRYITNFDTMGVGEKRTILVNFLGAKSINRLSDAKIDELFKKKFRDIIKELEADVARDY
jgi:hypothetical protein